MREPRRLRTSGGICRSLEVPNPGVVRPRGRVSSCWTAALQARMIWRRCESRLRSEPRLVFLVSRRTSPLLGDGRRSLWSFRTWTDCQIVRDLSSRGFESGVVVLKAPISLLPTTTSRPKHPLDPCLRSQDAVLCFRQLR